MGRDTNDDVREPTPRVSGQRFHGILNAEALLGMWPGITFRMEVQSQQTETLS